MFSIRSHHPERQRKGYNGTDYPPSSVDIQLSAESVFRAAHHGFIRRHCMRRWHRIPPGELCHPNDGNNPQGNTHDNRAEGGAESARHIFYNSLVEVFGVIVFIIFFRRDNKDRAASMTHNVLCRGIIPPATKTLQSAGTSDNNINI